MTRALLLASTIDIRIATYDDDAIEAINPFGRTLWREGTVWVASLDGLVVAFASVVGGDQIRWFAVSTHHRRRGIGRALVKHLIAQYDQQQLWVTVRTTSPGARKFWRAMGFRHERTVPNYYGPRRDGLRMVQAKSGLTLSAESAGRHVAQVLVFAIAAVILFAVSWFTVLALSGCALDVTETASMDELARMNNKRSLERLVVEFETVPETREEVAKGLIRRGRRWFAEHPGSLYTNLVIAEVGKTAASSHIDATIRSKAVWVLGEIAVLAKPDHARHEAKAAIVLACGDSSMSVGEEVAIALNKLGFTSLDGVEARGPELADGYTTVDGYDPAARGHLEEVE